MEGTNHGVKRAPDGQTAGNSPATSNRPTRCRPRAIASSQWDVFRWVAAWVRKAGAGPVKPYLFKQDYLPTGTLVVAPDPDPTGTLTPTLTVPPPARMPSLAATVVMNVFTMVFRYRFSVLNGLLGT